MSAILILSYRLKEVTNSYVLHYFWTSKMFISLHPDVWLRWDLNQNVAFEMDKWFILKNQKLSIANMWLIPLDHVTYTLHVHAGSFCVKKLATLSWNSRDYLRNPWTQTRFVCTQLNVESKYGNKIFKVWPILTKKWRNMTCHLLSTPKKGGLKFKCFFTHLGYERFSLFISFMSVSLLSLPLKDIWQCRRQTVLFFNKPFTKSTFI